MAHQDIPRRTRDPRTGETPEPPQTAHADDPTHGVDPRRNRPAPTERPGLSGETAHEGAMQTARTTRRRNVAPTLGLVLVVAGVIVAAALVWF
jgi:hypothetical protein